MRVGLLTESVRPDAPGEGGAWCDRLVRGLGSHEFLLHLLPREPGAPSPAALPGNVRGPRTAPLWGPPPAGGAAGRAGRRLRRGFASHLASLVDGFTAEGPAAPGGERAESFAAGLYGLADLAGEHPGHLPGLLLGEEALRLLERPLRQAAGRTGDTPHVDDLLALADHLERALRPLSLDWYTTGPEDAPGVPTAAQPLPAGPPGTEWAGVVPALDTVDLCHATAAGPVALPGLLAARHHGVPLLVTEVDAALREHYLRRAPGGARDTAPTVRTLVASFERALAAETYRRAALITPGGSRARRWQERCGAPRDRLRTVHPGMVADPFVPLPDAPADDSQCLVWVGTLTPDKDLVGLVHAFAAVRSAAPHATLRIVGSPGPAPADEAYAAQLRALAAHLFPDEAADAHTVGRSPVTFEEVGSPTVPEVADAYAGAAVAVLSSVVEGFPRALVQAMFSGRATVSTDVGAVCEVIGGTGLVVPPRNPRALADACLALLRDPARRARLGAAARARALELFTVEQNLSAFRGIYLELMSGSQARDHRLAAGPVLPFALPAEARLPGSWAGCTRGSGTPHAGRTGQPRTRQPAPPAPGRRAPTTAEPCPSAPHGRSREHHAAAPVGTWDKGGAA
ncbi:glycosyltransferase [Streptomyces sp. NPDC059740]|uniref:glycosyltransferase n=1 Tax=Streptomyces sp. NPDC059740 TaxID=3346926 RepID=UPI003657382E